MIKFPLSAQGVADFQADLYLLDNPALIKEAEAVAADFLSWTAHHFELEVYLLEKLRFLPEAMRLQLGWCIALSIMGRRPLLLEDHRIVKAERWERCKLLYTFSCTAYCDSHDREKQEGYFKIVLRNA